MRYIYATFGAIALMVALMACFANDEGSVEQAVCGSFLEPLLFSLWSGAAGSPDSNAVARLPNAVPIVHTTKDGRMLKGYKLSGRPQDGASKGFLLVAQGNGMLAEQLLESLSGIAMNGLDVFVFDFRGYGNSEGKPRLKAFVSDYRELFESISTSEPGVRLLYGFSLGGVILLNLIGSGITFDRAVIDSTPSRLSIFGCPATYDPVNNFPKDGRRFLLIAGQRDQVVPLKYSKELVELARARGGRAEVRYDFAHPFSDTDAQIERKRLALVKEFLLGAVQQEGR